MIRFGANKWKRVQALEWGIFSSAWAGVGTSMALHFHLEDSWWGIAIVMGPMIVLLSFFISCLLQTFTIERR
jgi:hypothetical protein